MKYIKTDWSIPFYNLALEEYLLSKMSDDNYFFFYINDPSIIIGKNQNTIDEINIEYIKRNNITVARRLSGGGAVYHDEGNLNYSFVINKDEGDITNILKNSKPIVEALLQMGLDIQLSQRNDILLDNKKISGTAQFLYKDKILHHGTLLFNSDLDALTDALNVVELKIQSKGIKSVKSRVTNIAEYLPSDISIDVFKDNILDYLANSLCVQHYELSKKDIDAVENLVKSKFSTYEWNYGKPFEYEIQKTKKFPCGIIDLRLTVKDEHIVKCKIFGDFFSVYDISKLENILTGQKYSKDALYSRLSGINIGEYFIGLDLDHFILLLIED